MVTNAENNSLYAILILSAGMQLQRNFSAIYNYLNQSQNSSVFLALAIGPYSAVRRIVLQK